LLKVGSQPTRPIRRAPTGVRAARFARMVEKTNKISRWMGVSHVAQAMKPCRVEERAIALAAEE